MVKTKEKRIMENKKTAVLIIPYFGKKPDYFEIWLQSAEANKEYSFYIYTDIDLFVSEKSNVKIITTSFEAFVERFKLKLGYDIKINTPYKLCDYKPTYGFVLEDDIKEFLFWGYCDVDLIFGDISEFISQSMLNTYDKIYYHGHFTLYKNNETMRTLFKEMYPNVLNYKYAFHTNYVCHFDENGTVAYVDDNCKDIKTYFDWDFCDPPYNIFDLRWGNENRYAIWDGGKLYLYSYTHAEKKELIYIHLQKRKMKYDHSIFNAKTFAVIRNRILSIADLESEVLRDAKSLGKDRNDFEASVKNRFRNDFINNIKAGSLKYKLFSKLMNLKTR